MMSERFSTLPALIGEDPQRQARPKFPNHLDQQPPRHLDRPDRLGGMGNAPPGVYYPT